MPEQMTTDVRTLLDREPFDASAVADLREVLSRDPSRYRTLRDAVAAMIEREKGSIKPAVHLRLGVAEVLLGRYQSGLDHLNKAERQRPDPLPPGRRPREPAAMGRCRPGVRRRLQGEATTPSAPTCTARGPSARRETWTRRARRSRKLERPGRHFRRVPLPARQPAGRRRRAARRPPPSSRRPSASIATTPAPCSSWPTSTTSTATTRSPSTTTSAASSARRCPWPP